MVRLVKKKSMMSIEEHLAEQDLRFNGKLNKVSSQQSIGYLPEIRS
jgi:hypothetical protein